MEFIEFAKNYQMMCKSFRPGCQGCPFYERYGCCAYTYTNIFNHPEEAEKIVSEWMSAHSIMTNADKFKEVFGRGLIDGLDCAGLSCTNGFWNCADCENKDFWSKEYQPPKGDK